jgi:Na+/melibiose symporter-like transporter
MTILLAFGIPALLLGISITMMKFYKLDDKKMEEIQATIAEMKDKPKNIEDPAI